MASRTHWSGDASLGSESNIIEAPFFAPDVRCVKLAELSGSDLTESIEEQNGVDVMRIEKVNLLIQIIDMKACCIAESQTR